MSISELNSQESLIFLFCRIDFGGHESMSINIIEQILIDTSISVTVICPDSDCKVAHAVNKLIQRYSNILLVYHDQNLPAFQGLFLPFLVNKILKISVVLKQRPEQLVIVIAGGLEQSVGGGVASKWAKKTAILYTPFGRTVTQSGGRFAFVRDVLAGLLWRRRFDAYITITSDEAKALERNGVDKNRIKIFRNFLDRKKWGNAKVKDFNIGVTQVPKIAIVGRISFRQKRQDELVKCLAGSLNQSENKYRFDFLGDGPDLVELQELVVLYKSVDSFCLKGWVDVTPELLGQYEIVLVVSNLEADPLIVAEALLSGTRVLVNKESNAESRFIDKLVYKQKSLSLLLTKIEEVIEADPSEYQVVQKLYKSIYLRTGCGQEFIDIVEGIVGNE